MLTGTPMTKQPKMVPNRAIGSPMMAAIGLVQLSYWAERTRKATKRAIAKTSMVVEPAFVSW